MTDLPGIYFHVTLPAGREIALRGHITESSPEKIRETLRRFNFLLFQSIMCGDIADGLGVDHITDPFEHQPEKYHNRKKYTKKEKK